MTPPVIEKSPEAFKQAQRVPTQAGDHVQALTQGTTVVAERDAPATWLRGARADVYRLAALSPNWDSYGARPIDEQSLSWGIVLLNRIAHYVGIEGPTVTATPDGEVAFCWDAGVWSLDVSIDSSGLISFVYLDERDHGRDRDTRTRDPGVLVPILTQWN